MSHPELLQPDRIDPPGHDEIVAQRDAVPTLLSSPAADPLAPGAIQSEPVGEQAREELAEFLSGLDAQASRFVEQRERKRTGMMARA